MTCLLGEDWPAWLVYIGAGLVLAGGLGYGLWKGNDTSE